MGEIYANSPFAYLRCLKWIKVIAPSASISMERETNYVTMWSV